MSTIQCATAPKRSSSCSRTITESATNDARRARQSLNTLASHPTLSPSRDIQLRVQANTVRFFKHFFYSSQFFAHSIFTILFSSRLFLHYSLIYFSCCFFFSCFVLWFAVFSLRLCSFPSLLFSCAGTHHLWLNQCGGSATRSFLFSALQFSPLISHRHASSNSLVVFVFRGGIRAVISFSPSRHSRLWL